MTSFYITSNSKFGWPELQTVAHIDIWEPIIEAWRLAPEKLTQEQWDTLNEFENLLYQLPRVTGQTPWKEKVDYVGAYYVRGLSHTLNHAPYGGVPKNNGMEQWKPEIVQQILQLPNLTKILKKIQMPWNSGSLTRASKLIQGIADKTIDIEEYQPTQVNAQRACAKSFALYLPAHNLYYTGKHRNTPLISGAILFENIQSALHSAKLRSLKNFVVVEAEIVATKIVDTSLLTQGSLDVLEEAISLQERERLQEALNNANALPSLPPKRKI